MTESRPPLTAHISGAQLVRWYWLSSELATFARSLGIPVTGGKQELTARLVAYLDRGGMLSPEPAAGVSDARPATRVPRRPPAAALTEPLTAETVIPDGQRCTQQLRHYFAGAVGAAFRFDGAMRDFIANGAGRTLGAAVDHWHETRSRPRGEIGAQFELNRFLRDWHQRHPAGSRSEALDAWKAHRALPVDARGQ